MPADYKYFDNGEERTILNVLNPVSLTGVQTTSGQFLVTVASTTGLYPGMAVSLPHIPAGAFIHAIHSATVIEIWASAWDASTGVFTTSGANAAATTTDTTGNLIGTAQGFNPRCLITQTYARGTWRNIHNSDTNGGLHTYLNTLQEFKEGHQYGLGVAIIPTSGTYHSSGYLVMNGHTVQLSDTLAATPLKRHNGEPWSFFILVSTGGFQSFVPALPGRELIYSGVPA